MREQLQATLGMTFAVDRELGGGGMSRVFLADERRLGRKVVIKVLAPELAHGLSIERFEREIRTAAALQQANIVPVLAAGEVDGLPWFSMPYVEGESLRARLAGGPLPVAEVVGIVRDVARALAYAHARGVVHRDIKPDNVLLSGRAAVVVDFGIAKALAAARTDAHPAAGATLTQAGTSIGTPAYMAPEQVAGDPTADHRVDLYALGVLAYELLSGAPPFAHRATHQLLAAHLSETPVPLASRRPDVPAALAALVMRCLAKDPAARPASAEEVERALDAVALTGGETAGLPAVLVGGSTAFWQALAVYALAVISVAALAKLAITGIGLPDWVFPGALGVMALGLPAVLWTGYVQRVARRVATATPTRTPGGTMRGPGSTGTLATMALKAAPKASFSRAGRWGAMTVGAFVLLVGAFMGARAYGIGPGKTLLASGALRSTDQIVLADFSVNGGDASLGSVVSFAVRTGLGQSTLLQVVSQQDVAATLDLMGRGKDVPVDLATAREVAQRVEAKAVIDGTVSAVGSGWVLSARLVTADSGRELVAVQESGEGPRGLIDAADAIARRLRDRAGESLKAVQNAIPIWQARTASFAALKVFSEGVRLHQVNGNFRAAEERYRAAVRIDSTFAEAWRRLGTVLSNRAAPRASVDSALARAYALRDRVSPRERLQIEGSYFSTGPGHDRARAIAILEQGGSANNLGLEVRSRRDFARAESLFREAARDTSFALPYIHLFPTLIAQGRAAAAESMAVRAIRLFPADGRFPLQRLVELPAMRGDLPAAMRAADSLSRAGGPAAAAVRGPVEAFTLMRGQVARWRALRAASGTRSLFPGARARDAALQALVTTAVLGRAPTMEGLTAALAAQPLRALPDPDRPELQLAIDLAWAGRPAQARALVADWLASVRDTALRRERLPLLQGAQAAIAVAEKRWAEAIALFRKSDSLPDGPVDACTTCLPLNLARAFDAAGQPDSAIAQFERYLTVPSMPQDRLGLRGGAIFLPLVHERLGQLYEQQGNVARALEHDRSFVALWDKADPELQPRVAAARARIAKLAPVEPRRP